MAHVVRLGVNVVPESGGFEPEEIFRLFDAWPRTSMFAAPTMVKRLVECPARLRSGDNIRTIVWGGAPMYVEDALKALDRFGPRLAQIYGQGESPMTITTLSQRRHRRPRRIRAGASGSPRPAGRSRCVEVTDRRRATTADCRAGETGEILCRGDVVMAGLLAQPGGDRAQTLRGGWLHTGDVGAFDADGYLTLKDRSKDLIISGGSNIYPREVEEVLLKHAGVREVSVIGRPRPRMGRGGGRLCGRRRRRPSELDALCLVHIARFKRPKDYVFVDALPKNNYGKILKTELRDIDAQRSDATG